MPTKIILKNSAVASSVPTAGDLDQGEVALNVTDRKIYSKDSGGNIVTMGAIEGAPVYGWVNFNGSTLAINGSYNVASISTFGTGDYEVYFPSTVGSNTYAVFGSSMSLGGVTSAYGPTNGSFGIRTYNSSGSAVNPSAVYGMAVVEED